MSEITVTLGRFLVDPDVFSACRLKSSRTERKASNEPKATFFTTPGGRKRDEDIFKEKKVLKNVENL